MSNSDPKGSLFLCPEITSDPTIPTQDIRYVYWQSTLADASSCLVKLRSCQYSLSHQSNGP